MIGTTNISTLISISIILQEADTVTVHIQLSTTLVQTMDRESYNGEHLGQGADKRQLLHWSGLSVE